MKASIYNIEPFDAKKGTIIKFSWAGNIAKGNTLRIVDSETKKEVYNHKVDTKKLEHEIVLSEISAANPLQNGRKYTAYIIVHSDDGDSVESSGKSFLCFTTPTFKFANIPVSVPSSSYQFVLNYSQAEQEKLDSWKISIYDNNNHELSTTNLMYETSDLSHMFYGFTSGLRYKVRGYGQTVNGMKVDTGYVVFSVDYTIEEIFSKLDLTNINNKAAVLISSNIVRADGRSKSDVAYIDGEWANLTSNYVIYDEGFNLEGDFSQVLYVRGLTRNYTFFDFWSKENPNLHGTITYRIGYDENNSIYGQFELKVTNTNSKGLSMSYVLYSDRIIGSITKNTIIGLCLVRHNGLYDLQIINKSAKSLNTKEEI